jgi:hypothetical protein
MKAPRVFLMVVAIALAAGIGPALTDAVDMTAASLSKAVDALEAATGGKRYARTCGCEHRRDDPCQGREVVAGG